MFIRRFSTIVIPLVAGWALPVWADPVAPIEAAIKIVDITPPIGGQTTGYAGAPPTTAVHDPVEARILLLRSRTTTVGLVVCDLCIFNSSELHAQAPELGLDHLLLMNTHTHAGPNMRQEDFPSTENPWRQTVEQRIAAGIRDAQEAWFPAYFAADEGQIQLGYNRLVREGEIAVTHFENPDRIPYGEVDPSVGVVRITDDQQRVRAVLVIYACHPVVLGPRNAEISADYPGVMRRLVEQHLRPADATIADNAVAPAVCFFIQGGGGDINPLAMARGEDRSGDFAVVERTGMLLATEVQRTLARMSDDVGQSRSLRVASEQVVLRKRFAPAESITLGVATLLINDDITAITMPGEPFHKFQSAFRERSTLRHGYLFGYCCNSGYDWPSYLPDLDSAARGGYGASDTTVAEVGAGERLVDIGLRQLFTLRGFLKPEPVRQIQLE